MNTDIYKVLRIVGATIVATATATALVFQFFTTSAIAIEAIKVDMEELTEEHRRTRSEHIKYRKLYNEHIKEHHTEISE